MSKTALVGLLTLNVVIVSACGPSGKAATRVTGAGSTFAYPLYSKWADAFGKSHPDVQIDYQPLGSSAGINLVTSGRADFGGTDGPMTDQQLKEFVEQRGCAVLHIPMALGADVPSYNVPGITTSLKFTPQALAGIFLGTITKWNDPALTSVNADVALPDNPITVVHRSDGSGTTYVWTDYLSKVSEDWQRRAGRNTSVKWPVGVAATGNQGVAEMIKATPNSVGYVELTYAIRETLLYGDVQNLAGEFVKADFHTVTAAATESLATMPPDFRVSITNPPGAHAYPIASFTWALVPTKITDAAKRQSLVAFLNWGLTDGQAFAEELAYARLPDTLIEKVKTLVAQIQ